MRAAAAAVIPTGARLAALPTLGGTTSRTAVIVSGVRRSRQTVARRELQKRAKQEYLKNIYESADRIEEDHLVFDLQPSSPRVRAQLQEADQHAELNKELAQQIPALNSWQQLQEFVQQHGPSLNFLNVVAVTTRAAALAQAEQPYDSKAALVPGDPDSTATATAAAAADPSLVAQLSVLVLQKSSWFQPAHFAASAVALCDLGVSDHAVWMNLVHAAEHKVGAFTFSQLAATLEALAAAGYTPELQWVERSYRQASKHLHAADPTDVCALMGAWGEMGYTPRDRLFLNQVKTMTRRTFDQGQLSGADLVKLMHGLARMPRYTPNTGWLAALAAATQQQLQTLTPGAIVDLLLSFAALDFAPPELWMDAALARIQDAMADLLPQQQDSSSSSSGQQQQQQLFLPPLDLQQLAAQQQLLSPGLLEGAGSAEQLPVDAFDIENLQQLFDEAEEGEDGDISDTEQQQQQELQGSQQQTDPQDGPLSQQQQLAGLGGTAARLGSRDSGVVDALSLQRQLRQGHLAVEHLGLICWCLGRLQFEPSPEWMQLLGQVLMAGLQRGDAVSQEVLVDVLLGCAAIGYLPVGHLQQQLLSQVLVCVPSMPPESLRRACQGLVALEKGLQQHQQQPAALALVLQQGPGAAGAAAAAAAASDIMQPLQSLKQDVAAAITHRQGIVLMGSSTAQLADVLAFMAAADQAPSLDYMTAAVTRAVNKLADGCPTPSVCTLLWALARMGFKPHPELLHQLLAVLQRGLHRLSSQDLADAGWALCTLRHRPGGTWLSLFTKEVAAKASYMEAQALTDTLWALACFAAQPDREWLKQVVQVVGSKAAAGELSRDNAAVAVWALQQLGFQPGMVAGTTQAQGAAVALVQLVQPLLNSSAYGARMASVTV